MATRISLILLLIPMLAFGEGSETVKVGAGTHNILSPLTINWTGSTLDFTGATVSGLGGGGAVSSVFGRTGAVVSATNDYTFSQIGSTPTTLSGYGITDAYTKTASDGLYAPIAHVHTFASLTSTPTTLAGYGITDAQPLDSDLTTIAGLTATTDNFIIGVASAWASRTPAQARTTLGLVIGTNVQAWDTDLDTWATKTPYAGTVVVTTGKTFTSSNTLTLAGTDGSTLNIGAGGTLGSNAFNSTAFGTGTVTSVGLAGTSNQITVTGTSPITTSGSFTLSVPTAAQLNVAKLTNLTTNGFVKTGGSDGTLSVDTNTYLTTASAASTYQPLDGDLTSLASASLTNVIYYRSAASTWSGVTLGANMSFSGGVLDSTVTGASGTVVEVITDDSGSSKLFTAPVTDPNVSPVITFVLANVGAHKFWGNNTGSTTAPDYVSITASDVPTLNQNTTGSAASLSVSGQTGLMTVTGLTSTNRAKTVRDAADTILELGGSYTPTGTWTSLTMVTPVLGTPTSGNLSNCTFPTLNQNTSGSAATLTTARNLWGVSFNGSANIGGAIELGTAGTTDTTLDRSAAGVATLEGVTIATASNAITETNKNNVPRTHSTASATSWTPDFDSYDQEEQTALAGNITAVNAPTFTGVTNGSKRILRFKANGSGPYTIGGWNAIYVVMGTTLPLSIAASKTIYMGMIYNGNTSKWDVVAVSTEQ